MVFYSYILGIGVVIAGLDAFSIGANDNANNFANAIAAKVITPFQAVAIAIVFEFLGAILVGNNVAEAIRGRIINVNLFKSNPALLQLGMLCALIGSSTWIMLATRYGWPVSTTHSIIGAVIGMGIAAFGSQSISWDYNTGRGLSGIVASWFISIAVSGVMAGALYLVMKFSVLRYKNSFQRSLVFGPIVFGLTYGIMVLALVWKGTPKLKLDKITDNEVIAIVLGTWVCTSAATYLWVSLPLYRYHWLGQDLRWIDFLLGPVACDRPVRAGFDDSHQEALVGKGLFNSELDDNFVRAEEEIAAHNAKVEADAAAAAKLAASETESEEPRKPTATDAEAVSALTPEQEELAAVKAKLAAYEAKNNTPRKVYELQWREDFRNASVLGKAYLLGRYFIMFGIDGREITDYNQGDRAHLAFAPRHEGRTEEMYKSLNVITSCIQAFAHGSNDVANAIGPLSTIYFVWQNNQIPGASNAPVELWQLGYGGIMIGLGLWFYGYNIMRVLGNNLTYQSPSRGFCMDVGSAITVIIASKEGFPVSTTQCITGATVGVGIANGDLRSVNWKLFLKIFAGWIITLPAAGLLSGCIFGFVAFAPSAAFNPTHV